ncbi:MFS transporter [Nocardiopsis sp. CNT-189]
MAVGVTSAQRAVLAAVCAAAVSTVYAIQPVLEPAGAELGLAPESLGWLAAAGQFGYLAGLVLLVPLGDVLDRRRLITAHLVLVAAGAGTAALAPSGPVAAAGLAAAGLFAVVVQIAVAYAAAVSAPGERGRSIGAVTSGVVVGILGVRVLAGALAGAAGWRAVYLVLALLCLALAATARAALRPDPRTARVRYARAVGSTVRLAATDRLLLGRGLIALFLFASFGTLWGGLALPLGAEPWSLGTAEIGLFGLAGLAGALGAARAGRWADRGRAEAVSGRSLVLLTASWPLIAWTEPVLWPLIAGVVLLDFAVQAVHVSSQHLLATAHADRASGVIGAYMAFYSLGSALGAVTSAWAYASWGWWASCLAGASYALLGLAVWAGTAGRPGGRAPRGGGRPRTGGAEASGHRPA